MTILDTNPVSGPHIADGINRIFGFTFKVFEVSHMRLRIVSPDGSSIEIDEGFTIPYEDLGTDDGGNITYPSLSADPLPAGTIVFPFREAPYEQPNAIGDEGNFYPDVHENTFDLLEMQIQQIRRAIDLSLQLPVGTDTGQFDTSIPTPPDSIANPVLTWDNEAGAFKWVTLTDVDNAVIGAGGAEIMAANTIPEINEILGIDGIVSDGIDQAIDNLNISTPDVDRGSGALYKTPDNLAETKHTYNRGLALFPKRNEGGIFDNGTPANEETNTLVNFLDYTRAGVKYAVGADGKYTSYAANVPAIEHENGAAKSFMITDNVVPLQRHSTDPTQWNSVVRLTPTDVADGPIDGEISKKFTIDAIDNTHDLRELAPLIENGETYLFEFITKYHGHNAMLFLGPEDCFVPGFFNCRINFETGAVYSRDENIIDFGVKDLDNDYNYSWFTIEAIDTITGADMFFRMLDQLHSGANSSFLGDGVSGFELSYFNISKGVAPNPIMVTDATPATASVGDDRADKDTPIDFFKRTPICVDIEISEAFVTDNSPRLYYMTNGTDIFQIRMASSTRFLEARLEVDSVIYSITSKRLLSDNVLNKVSVFIERDAFGFSEMVLYIDGEFQSSTPIPQINFDGTCTHYFGKSNGSNNMMSGGIEKLMVLAELPEKPLPAISVVGGIGPSLMNGDTYGLAEREFFVNMVARKFGPHCKSYNFAVSGSNTMEGLIDQLPKLLAVKPHIGLIGTGNFETGTVAGTPTLFSIELSPGDDETVYRAGAWIDVDVRAAGAGDAVLQSMKIDTLVGKVITFATPMSAIPQVGADIFEGVAHNVAAACDALSAIGCIAIVCGFPYQNTPTEPQRDTVLLEGSRADERQRARDGVLLSLNGVYSDHYAGFSGLINNGFAVQDDGQGHISDDNFHHTLYGQQWQRAYPTILTLREIGFKI